MAWRDKCMRKGDGLDRSGIRLPELLSPAGDMECLMGAINAGADAVYLGGGRFGARAYAKNFTDEELKNALIHAHLSGVKLYLTVNTLMRQSELSELLSWLSPFYEQGLDGVIVQDLGLFSLLKKHFPELSLHASTQMAVTGHYGCEALRKMGASRVVPARELTLEELALLRQNTAVELEVFIHGAMCYSFSGLCLFSSMLGGRSGNRGRCAGPCRQPYRVRGIPLQDQRSAEGYYLSMKDLCALPLLPKLVEIGVDSFKIEGRMKSAEYVAGVTAVYRKYLDRIGAGEKWQVSEEDLTLLAGLYLRTGFSTGFLEKRNSTHMVTIGKPGYGAGNAEKQEQIRKRYLNGFPKHPISMEVVLEPKKQSLCIITPTSKNEKEIISSDIKTNETISSDIKTVELKTNDIKTRKIRSSETISNDAKSYDAKSNDIRPIDTETCASAVQPYADHPVRHVISEASADIVSDIVSEVSGDIVQEARSAPLSEEEVIARMGKLGDTPFVLEHCSVKMTGECFMPAAALNRLRRDAATRLLEKLLPKRTLKKSCDIQSLDASEERELFFPQPDGDGAFPAGPGTNDTGSSIESRAASSSGGEFSAVPDAGLPGKDVRREAGQDHSGAAYMISISNADQLKALLFSEIKCHAILPLALAGEAKQLPASFFLSLPCMIREGEEELLRRALEYAKAHREQVRGFLIRNLEEAAFLDSHFSDGAFRCIMDHSIYVWNTESIRFIREMFPHLADGLSFSLPLELSGRELTALKRRLKGEALLLTVYGRAPLMQTAGCLKKTMGKCDHRPGVLSLQDRFGAEFPVEVICEPCGNRIYNSVPMSLFEERMPEREGFLFRIDLTLENEAESREVLKKAAAFLAGGMAGDHYAIVGELPASVPKVRAAFSRSRKGKGERERDGAKTDGRFVGYTTGRWRKGAD